jgi:YD repeat-containing protein
MMYGAKNKYKGQKAECQAAGAYGKGTGVPLVDLPCSHISGCTRRTHRGICDIPAQGAGNNGQLRSDYDLDVTGTVPNRVLPDTSHTDTFTYDSQGRLTQTVGAPFNSGAYYENLTFSYDNYGNMTCVQNQYTAGTCAQASFDTATNRITLVGTGVPTYNTKGELLTDGYTLNTYSYDAEGRLTKINNCQHVSVSYAYNALGQLVEDNESNWGGLDNEINYDPFGRRIGDYANGTRGYGYWAHEYVPSDKPNVTYQNAPDIGGPSQGEFPSPGAPASQPSGTPNAEGSWQEENASSQEAIGNYKGDASTTSSSEWTQYRNQMGSKRWGTANGQNPAADSLYDPHGNEWYVCGIYGSGVSSYDGFGIYCICYGPTIDANGRPYFPRYGRYLGVKSPLRQNLLDPNDLNGYGYKNGDPINNDGQQQNAGIPAPTNPDGTHKPPPIPVPRCPSCGWKWNPDSQNPRGGTWGPSGWKGANPPKGSWDDEYGHWDINPGTGEPVDHYDPDGNWITPEEAHPGNPQTKPMSTVGPWIGVGVAFGVIQTIIESAPEWLPLVLAPF